MDRDLINFYLDVVQELIDRGVPATIENINKHLAPANKEADIIEALDTLVAEGRLVRTAEGLQDYQIAKA
ncbi:MAG: hypothetical protein ABI658_26885 [Acidimicrobiales bacterium]